RKTAIASAAYSVAARFGRIEVRALEVHHLSVSPISVQSVPISQLSGPSYSKLLDCRPPAITTIDLPLSSPRIRTVGRLLPEGSDALKQVAATVSSPSATSRSAIESSGESTCKEPLVSTSRPASTWTRIRPPRDVVKVEDRLAYLLQP